MSMTAADHIGLMDAYSAHNYHPLPVVAASASGAWLTDVDGTRYLDFLSAYSALNFGHRHPALVQAAHEQLDRLTLTSRAFHNDQLGPFCQRLAALCGMEAVLPMNTGAEAVETAVKTARKWGYTVKGVPAQRAKILACEHNFHGRTTTIISFSDDTQARSGFGPYTPGFELVPYGDVAALEAAIDEHTVGFLVEPIQGEAGVVVPPDGYLRRVREVCTRRNVLFMADEIQSGLGRTGKTFACEHEGVKPDLYILGKALGGGVAPLSAVVSSRAIMSVFNPGDHGSTFGGNPLACAVGLAVLQLLERGDLQARAARLGERMLGRLRGAKLPVVEEVRGRGLWAGVQLRTQARPYCEELMRRGVLCKDTHGTTIRLAPPLIIDEPDLERAVDVIVAVLAS